MEERRHRDAKAQAVYGRQLTGLAKDSDRAKIFGEVTVAVLIPARAKVKTV